MHSIALIVMLLAGGAPGSSVRPGLERDEPRMLGPFVIAGGILAGSACAQWPAPRPLRIRSMHFTETVAGVGSAMTYAVKVNGSSACSIVVACDSSGRQDAECDVEINQDDDVEVAVATDNCLVSNPSGTIILVVQ